MVGNNNALNVNTQGTVYFDGVGDFSGIDGGTSGHILTSNGTGVAPSFQTNPTVNITTIDGDSGSITGSTVTIYAHSSTESASVKFVNSGTTSTLNVTDSKSNTFVGDPSGNTTLSGSYNTGGRVSLELLTSGAGNSCWGAAALEDLTTGSYNTALGYQCLSDGPTTGSYNLGIGYDSGFSLSNPSSAILLNTTTAAGLTSNRLVIGFATGSSTKDLSAVYFYGINHNTLTNPLLLRIGSSTSELGTQASLTQYNVLTGGASNVINFVAPGAAGTVYTSNGASSQPSFALGAFGTRAATVFGTSSAPTGTTSTAAYKMMGLGSSWAITPKNYTILKATITGQMTNSTTGDGISIKIAHSTGSAPANGAAASGTVIGSTTTWTALTGLLTNGVPFSKTIIMTGFSPGTAYWVDLQVLAITGGTASVKNLDFSVQELQY